MATTLNGPTWTTAKITGLAMRISMAVNLAVGVLLIVVGCKLESPPAHYPSILFLVVGSLNLLATIFGLWGSYHKKRILMFFLVLEGVSVLVQLVFFVLLLIKFDNVVDVIVTVSTGLNQSEYNVVSKTLNIARWVLIGCIFFELLTLIMAVMLKWVIKEDDNVYHGFDQDENEKRALTLGTLRSDVERNASRNKSEKQYDKIREKMQSKYGATASGGDWKSKTRGMFNGGT